MKAENVRIFKMINGDIVIAEIMINEMIDDINFARETGNTDLLNLNAIKIKNPYMLTITYNTELLLPITLFSTWIPNANNQKSITINENPVIAFPTDFILNTYKSICIQDEQVPVKPTKPVTKKKRKKIIKEVDPFENMDMSKIH